MWYVPADAYETSIMDMIEIPLSQLRVRPEEGYCWIAELPDDVADGDTLDYHTRSTLTLFEDGRPLGPPHADHTRIRLVGGGLYSHWRNVLYFSSSDGSNPLSGGRNYVARAPRQVGPKQAVASDPDDKTLFPRLAARAKDLKASGAQSLDLLFNPTGA